MSDSKRFLRLALPADLLLLILLAASLLLQPESLLPAAPLAVILYVAVMATLLYPQLHRGTAPASHSVKGARRQPEGGAPVASHDAKSKTAACL